MGLTNNAPPPASGLRLKGLNHAATIKEMEQHAMEQALEWFHFKPFTAEEVFTEDFILFVHKKLFGRVWKQAGQLRQSDLPQGCRWSNIAIQLRQLNEEARDNFNRYAPDELALRYMHRLLGIYCFEQGNGRHARFMADLIVTKLYNAPPFTWGRLLNASPELIRKNYLASLEAADCNDYEVLMRFSRS